MRALFVLGILALSSVQQSFAGESSRYADLLQKAKAQMSADHPAAALESAQAAIAVDPAAWEAYVVATTVYERTGDSKSALQTVEEGLSHVPADKRPVLQKLLNGIALQANAGDVASGRAPAAEK